MYPPRAAEGIRVPDEEFRDSSGLISRPVGYDFCIKFGSVREEPHMKRYLVSGLVAAAFLVGAQAYAHHSFAATYLEDQQVTIEVELVQFLFRNPH